MKIVEDLSSSEGYKADLWLTDLEIQSFRYQMALTLRSLSSTRMSMAELFTEVNVETIMGLESYLCEDTIPNRKDAILTAVLSEQERQMDAGIYNPEKIATISLQISSSSARRANMIGLLHSKTKKPEVPHDNQENDPNVEGPDVKINKAMVR